MATAENLTPEKFDFTPLVEDFAKRNGLGDKDLSNLKPKIESSECFSYNYYDGLLDFTFYNRIRTPNYNGFSEILRFAAAKAPRYVIQFDEMLFNKFYNDVNNKILKNYWFHRVVFNSKNFSQSDLRGSIFANCHFENCNFTGANLRNCHLQTCTGLTQEQIEQAEGNEYTILPPNLYRPLHWFEAMPIDKIIKQNPGSFDLFINDNNKIALKYL